MDEKLSTKVVGDMQMPLQLNVTWFPYDCVSFATCPKQIQGFEYMRHL